MTTLLFVLLLVSSKAESVDCPEVDLLEASIKSTGGYPGWNVRRVVGQWPYRLEYLEFFGSDPGPFRECTGPIPCVPPQTLMMTPDKRERGKMWIENESKGSLWVGCVYAGRERVDFIYREIPGVLRCSAWVGETRAQCQITSDG
jgi:hypothetical protein